MKSGVGTNTRFLGVSTGIWDGCGVPGYWLLLAALWFCSVFCYYC